uniref:Uncharacterized protein n=1 Tax=Nelumbo nucifera TaxID=4432 RepID=A0A822Y0P0_NELNU|nr:TPA_asm: hypothetical protein HUJ06_027638 [Nelumbo nucifera]
MIKNSDAQEQTKQTSDAHLKSATFLTPNL